VKIWGANERHILTANHRESNDAVVLYA